MIVLLKQIFTIIISFHILLIIINLILIILKKLLYGILSYLFIFYIEFFISMHWLEEFLYILFINSAYVIPISIDELFLLNKGILIII